VNDLPFMPLWIAKYDARTAHLTIEEDGAYMRLLRLCWVTPKCQLPADDAWIRRKMRVDQATYDRVVLPILGEFFKRSGSGTAAVWFNPKLIEVYDDNFARSRARSEAGSRGGKSKALKSKAAASGKAKDLLDGLPQANEQQTATKPKPDSIAIKACKQALEDRVRKSFGPGVAEGSDDWGVSEVVSDWLALGASEDEIVDVVLRQTAMRRARPIRSLRALTPDIFAALEARKAKPEAAAPAAPAELTVPDGIAGDCVREICRRYGIDKAAPWLGKAVWLDNFCILEDEFSRSQVDQRFGGVLSSFGLEAVTAGDRPRLTA
jgi:uncharacterized protein YdaU (DUF1376 family)